MDPVTGLPPGFVLQPPPDPTGLPPGFVLRQPAAPAAAPVPVTPGGVPIGPDGRPRVEINTAPKPVERPASLLPSSVGGAVRDFTVGAQGVGKGLTDIVTGPFDLVAGAQNLITSGINKVAGTNIPMATPASKLVEKGVDALDLPFIDRETMAPSEKLAYDASRFGTQSIGVGAMLAQRAPQVAAQVLPSPTVGGRTLDTLARPYTSGTRAHVGDAVGGIGAGAAVNAVENYIPEHAAVGGTATKQVASALAPLVGGMGANGLQATAEGLGGMLRNIARRALSPAPSEIPLRANKTAYSVPDIDRAATQLQDRVSGAPKIVAQDLRENAQALSQPTRAGETPVERSQMPTSGLLSQDPGLVTMENAARTRSSPDFFKRDQSVKEAAGERVEGLRDPEADLGSIIRRAAQARTERMAPAEQHVADVEKFAGRVEQARQEQGADFAGTNTSAARVRASQRLDTAIVDKNYIPARAEKNRQFDTAPGRTEQLPADDVFAAIDRVRAGVNELGPVAQQLPAEFIQRLDRLRPRIDPDSGENIGGAGTVLGGDLADLRKYLNVAQQKAEQGGNFDLSTNIGHLRRAINRTINEAPGYADANANYGQFADRFRPGPGDEAAKFTKEIDRDGTRSKTPPSETAGRFLSTRENAAALRRIVDGASNEAEAMSAIGDFFRSSFARSALNPDGTVNPIRADAWSRHHSATLSLFPTVERELGAITLAARKGQKLSADAQEGLAQARAKLQATETEIDRSAVGTLLREDPRDVASDLLSGGYSSEKKLDEILALVKNDAPAKRGWKAAVAEVLADRVQGSRQVGETPEVQFARLSKEFKDNEALLTKTFSPDEMNSLRQGHKLLSYFKEAEKRGAQPPEPSGWSIPNVLQLGARHIYGDLKGGGIIKRFKLLLEQLPTNKQNADEIVQMAWFNPDVAAFLLERPVKNANVPSYNIDLRRLIAADNAARESGPRDHR